MRNVKNLLPVIYMLSTIVILTDCCSSRILLLREHTLKIVQHQHNFHNHLHEHAHQLQQQIEERVANIVTQMELNKNRTYDQLLASEVDSSTPAISATTDDDEVAQLLPSTTTASLLNLDRPPPDDNQVSTTPTPDTATDATTTSTPPAPTTGNSKYHIIDLYYTIMRDVLSFECSGQYLTDFCLNGGRCFRYPLGNDSFFSCECADGYIGERCESKSLNELYAPTHALDSNQKPKILMARIVFTFPMLILLSIIYLLFGAVIIFRCPPAKQRSGGLFLS